MLEVFRSLSHWRLSLASLICTLVIGVVALGAAAKHSQYYSNNGATHLSKATKMETCRTETGAAMAQPATEFPPLDTPVGFTAIIWAAEPARNSPRALRLETRPPPLISFS